MKRSSPRPPVFFPKAERFGIFRQALVLAAMTLFFALNASADFLEKFGLKKKTGTNQAATLLASALSQEQMIAGLKEALEKGLKQSVSSLGRTNGFLTNLNVRIPLPEKLAAAEKTLRSLGQEQLADDFVTTMNRAAEQAVPVATTVFVEAMKQMTIDDAKGILTGTDDAATQFFKRTTQTNLAARFLPIVQKATTENKVTGAYKALIEKAAALGPANQAAGGKFGSLLGKGEALLGRNTVDVDAYVTEKALDGLFKMVAEEEKKIRQNPAARTTELLQKVFGAVRK